MNRLHTRLAGLGSCSRRAQSMSEYMKRANNPKVKKARQDVKKAHTRKRGAKSEAQEREDKKVEAKVERDSKRLKVLEDIAEAKGAEIYDPLQRDIDKQKEAMRDDY